MHFLDALGAKVRGTVTALILALLPVSADAAATYRWQSESGNGCCTAVIEITNEAYAAGALSVRIDYSGPPRAMPQSPVIRFEWSGYGSRIAFDREQVRGQFDFDINLQEKTLTGRIRANDLSSDTLLMGLTGAWAVQEHHSDRPGDCFRAENSCAGATGHWVLVSPPVE